MTKEDIKRIIKFVQLNGGTYTCDYIPSSELTPEKCAGLYYGGGSKLTISRKEFYLKHLGHTWIDYSNMDESIDKIYQTLKDNVGGELHQAISNLEWEYEELKYFEGHPENFERFINEIKRIKRDNTITEISVPEVTESTYTKEEVKELLDNCWEASDNYREQLERIHSGHSNYTTPTFPTKKDWIEDNLEKEKMSTV